MGLLTFIFAVAASAVLSHAIIEQCPTYDTADQAVYLPHPHDCSLFRRCQAGTPILGHCPPGQYFNPGTLACDDPAHSNCKATPNTCSARIPQSTCRYECVCNRDEQNSACPAKMQFGAELNVIDLALASGCEREPSSFVLRGNKFGDLSARNTNATVSMCDSNTGAVDVPHFADCTKAVRCEDGKEVLFQCNDGTFYNPSLGYCDKYEYASCPFPTVRPATIECSQDVALSKCLHACSCEVLEGSCPARLGFRTTTSIFHAGKQPACLKGPVVIALDDQFSATLAIHPNTVEMNHCPDSQQPAPIYIRDPWNCGVVTVCENGKDWLIYCPNNKYFSLNTLTCVNPDRAVCHAVTPPITQPPVTMDNITCPSAVSCPAGSNRRVAHLTDCTLFCQCTQGTPTMRACPPGLHFNAHMQTCERPDTAKCKAFCHSLSPSVGGTWSPKECAVSDKQEGASCKLTCGSGHRAITSKVVRCTKKGWINREGLNAIPTCKRPAVQVGVTIVDKINETMNQFNQAKEDVSLLFILDESGSVGKSGFQTEKDFVSALVNAFPLSKRRSARVITFSDHATVGISMTATDTCYFLSRLKRITYTPGGSDIANALRVALREINLHFPNKKSLVFLITDGMSNSNPVSAAQSLRSKGCTLFTIRVAGDNSSELKAISSTHKDGSKLFFGLPNFRVLRKITGYLNKTHKQGPANLCP